MMEMLLLYLVLAVGFSFLCSILEAVLLSIPPSYIAAQSSAGTKRGAALSRLKADIDRPLSAILTLNTFAHTIGAAGVGAQAFEIWGEESLGIVSAVVPLLS
jgi:CBS domain containing-hemolysin-like protein